MLPNSGNHGLNPTDKTNSRASTSQDLRSQTSSGNDGGKKRRQDNPIYSAREARARRKVCSVGKTDSNNSKTEVQNTDGSFDNWACTSKERQDASASSHKSKVCAAHGMRATFHGFIYQITWLVKLLRYALNKGKNFCLQSEEPGFGLFDDAILEIEKEDGRKSTILVQFKHSSLDSTKIDYDSLFLDENSKFYLPKYCASSIISGYEQNLGGANVSGTHILCTNIRLDLGNDASNDPVEVSRKKSPKVILRSKWGDEIQLKQVGDTYGDLFNNGGARYSFGHKDKILSLVRDRCIEQLEEKIKTLKNNPEKLTKNQLLKDKLCSLIDKGGLDESIRKFFDGFVLAVSQPKGVELETITVNELSKEFNLGNGDVIYNQFKEKISAWVKKRKGEPIYKKDGEEFNELIKNTLHSLSSIGLTSLARQKLEKLGLEFEFKEDIKELAKFLTSGDKRQAFFLAEEDVLVGASKVHQALNKNENYEKEDSNIFVKLKTLCNISERLMGAFRAEKCKLLVIQCKTGEYGDVVSLFDNIVARLRKDSKKKVILIANEYNALANLIEEKFSKIDTSDSGKESDNSKFTKWVARNSSFAFLTPESQKSLEGKDVDFQGKETKLGLIAEREFLCRSINREVLGKLIRGEPIKIGSEIPASDHMHINRTFASHSIIEMPEPNDLVDRDIFAISKDSNPSKKPLRKKGLIELSNVDPEKHFKQICESNKDNNVHWLRKVGSSRFLHVKSVGSLCNLRKSVKVGKIKGEGLLIQRRLAIVTGEPGSGKSREFDKLCEQLKREKPHLWAIRINLFDCRSELSKVDSNPEDLDKSLSSVVEFLLQIGQLNDKFAQDLFKHNLLQKDKDKVAFLFDGFDEVRSSCKAKVLELLKFLRGLSGVANLYISSRPHVKGELEDSLGIFACELNPLLMEDQKKILRFLFTKETIESANVSKERVRTLVDELLDSCSQDLDKKFILGNPLGLEILAKFFEKKPQESSIEAYDFNYPDLLEYYIGYKIHLYTEKIGLSIQGNSLRTILDQDKPTLGSNNADELSKSRTFREAIKQHESFKRRFAALFLKDLFGDETYLSISREKEENQEDLRMIGHLHLSILEYHIARFFADEYLRDPYSEDSKILDSLEKYYFHPDGKRIRYFFDLIISKDCPLHVNVINGNYDQIKEIIESKDADRREKLLELDDQDRSVLHLVQGEELRNFLTAFKTELKSPRGCVSIFYDACVSKDKIFNYTPLDYAIRSGDYEVANQILRLRVLVEKSDANFLREDLLKRESQKHTLDTDDFKECDSILFAAIKNRLFYLSLYLMETSWRSQLTKEDHCGRQPLYYILCYETLTSWKGKNMFSYISKRIDLNTQDHYGQAAGHFFANMLLQLKGSLVDELKHRFDYSAVLSIIRKKVNMNVFDKNGNSPLHLASDKLNVVKLLVEGFSADVNKHRDGKSILHTAISMENLEMIKYLYFKGACLDQKDSDGNTPLHLAVRGKSQHTLEIVKFLVEGGANFESENNQGNTPKDIASGSVLEYLNNLPKYRKHLEGRADYLLSELRIKISNLLRTQETIYESLEKLTEQIKNMRDTIKEELMVIKRKRVVEAIQEGYFIGTEDVKNPITKEGLSLEHIREKLDVCKEEVLKLCESYKKLLEEMGAADKNLKQDKIYLKRMLQQLGEQTIPQNLLPILDKKFDYKKLTEMPEYSSYPGHIVAKIIEMNKEATGMRLMSITFLVGSKRSRYDKRAQKIEGEIQFSISETIKLVSEASNFLLKIINEYRGYLKKIEENSISFTIQSKNNFSIESILSGDRSKAEDTDSSHHRCRKRKLNDSYCIDKRKKGTRVQQWIPTSLPFLHSNFQYMPQPHEFQIAGYNSSNYDPSQKPQFQQGIPSTSSSTLEYNMLPLYQYPMRNLSQQSTFLLSPTSSMVFNDPGQQRQNYVSQSENQFLRAIGNPRTCLSSATIASVQGCGRDKK